MFGSLVSVRGNTKTGHRNASCFASKCLNGTQKRGMRVLCMRQIDFDKSAYFWPRSLWWWTLVGYTHKLYSNPLPFFFFSFPRLHTKTGCRICSSFLSPLEPFLSSFLTFFPQWSLHKPINKVSLIRNAYKGWETAAGTSETVHHPSQKKKGKKRDI